jgi:transposase
MSQFTLGIDVSKDTLDFTLLGGKKQEDRHYTNNEAGYSHVINWLRKAGAATLHACLESTGQYGEGVATYLHNHGYRVSVVNPARIKAYAASKLRRFKTDKGDAEVIALFCQKEVPPIWTPLPDSFRDLKYLVHHMDDLKKMRQQERNRLKSGVTLPSVLADLKDHIDYLSAQIKQAANNIARHIDKYPELKKQKELLKSIPGIGDTTAAALLGEVRDFRAFDSARQLAAYAGLVPEQRDSGTSVHKKPRLAKNGNRNIRKALYMPALVAIQHNPIVRALSERLKATRHCPMSIIGAAMHKLLHLAYGVIKTDKPFDPAWGQKLAA